MEIEASMSRRRKATPVQARAAACESAGAGNIIDDVVEQLIIKSRRQLARGDVRRAIVILRQATSLDAYRARTFTLLAMVLRRRGLNAEAEQTLRHALWLRSRAGEVGRAESTSRLLAELAQAA